MYPEENASNLAVLPLARIGRVSDGAFTPLPRVPDHPAIEREVLAWWEAERIFDTLRDQNRGGPR